jgi:integrase
VQQLDSGRWRGVYRDSNGAQKSVGTFHYKEAAKKAAEKAEGVARNNPKVTTRLTFKEWEPRWKATRRVQESTARQDESKLVHHVRPRWNDVRLSDIDRDSVERWVTELRNSGLSASSVQKAAHVLSSVLQSAVVAGVLDANPVRGVKLPKDGPSPERFLTSVEAGAIRAVLTGFDQFIFDVLIGTGCRWGEAVSIHWDHVDFEQKRVEVAISYDRAARFFKPTKTHAKRYVPIGKTLMRALERRLDDVGYGEPPTLEYRDVRRPRSGIILPNADGNPYDGALFTHRLDAATRVAFTGSGTKRRKVGHVRVHDLRHTYASGLVQAGVPIQQVQKLLGHQSIATTERYAKLSDTQWDAVRNALG